MLLPSIKIQQLYQQNHYSFAKIIAYVLDENKYIFRLHHINYFHHHKIDSVSILDI